MRSFGCRRFDEDETDQNEAALSAAINLSEGCAGAACGTESNLNVKARAMEWKCQGALPGEISLDVGPETVEAFRAMLTNICAMG